MAKRVERVIRKTVGTTAENIDLGYQPAYIANAGTTTLYVKEKDWDDTDASSSNGFPIAKGCMINQPLAFRKLSVVSSGASGDLAILRVEDFI